MAAQWLGRRVEAGARRSSRRLARRRVPTLWLELLEDRTAPAGLVAAYSFNEGSGAAVADASGNGNNGTVANATWTAAGQYGGALSFNGANALVTVADAASLHL